MFFLEIVNHSLMLENNCVLFFDQLAGMVHIRNRQVSIHFDVDFEFLGRQFFEKQGARKQFASELAAD